MEEVEERRVEGGRKGKGVDEEEETEAEEEVVEENGERGKKWRTKRRNGTRKEEAKGKELFEAR